MSQLHIIEWKYVNDAMRRIWNEDVGADFMVLVQRLPIGAEKNQVNSQNGQLIRQESNLALSEIVFRRHTETV
jgi:hypothetical protein